MAVEAVAAAAAITAVNGNRVTFDRALPAGDVAYPGDAAVLPADGAPSLAVAGAPGFAVARVLVAAQGNRMAPHHCAIDVASDNRLALVAELTQ